MARRPPISTPFPTRRSSDLQRQRRRQRQGVGHQRRDVSADPACRSRSEEHTSELQSLAYLVCRLLLEKKNATFRKRNDEFVEIGTLNFRDEYLIRGQHLRVP